MLNVRSALPRTSVNGPGLRTLLHVQGCRIHCSGCFNKWSWSTDEARMVRPEDLAVELLQLGRGVSISGGEPMDQAEELACLVRTLRLIEPECSILMYTGYTLKQLEGMPYWGMVRDNLDVAVVGPYVASRWTPASPLIGSNNQVVLILSDRHTMDEVLGERATVEAHVGPDGIITMTGFPTHGVISALRAQEGE